MSVNGDRRHSLSPRPATRAVWTDPISEVVRMTTLERLGPSTERHMQVARLFRTKSIEQSLRDADEPDHHLARALGVTDLLMFGVGVTVGTGIFVLTGIVVAIVAALTR
jgi:amino acid permease